MAPLSAVVEAALSAVGVHDANLSACKLLLGKKELDLSTPLRFANLPTGAKLQLVTGAVPQSPLQVLTSCKLWRSSPLQANLQRACLHRMQQGCSGVLHMFQARSGGWVWASPYRHRACRTRLLRCYPLHQILAMRICAAVTVAHFLPMYR